MAKPYYGNITDILIRRGFITEQALAEVEKQAQGSGSRLERVLIEKGHVQPDDMTLMLAEYLRMPPVSLAHFTPNPQLLELLPREMITKRYVLPLALTAKTMTVALGDPLILA